MFPSDLDSGYGLRSDFAEVLIGVLGFRSDEIKSIEEKTGGKFIPKEEIAEYEQWKAERGKKDTGREEPGWKPETRPEETEIRIEEIKPEPRVTPDLREQEVDEGEKTEDRGKTREGGSRDTDRGGGQDSKEVGNWGEAYVLKALRKNYENEKGVEETTLGFKTLNEDEKTIEVKWLNKNGDTGKGYDFVISSNGIEFEYIEVKTKKSEDMEFISITGTQWEFARKLYDMGDGDKYRFYVVKNAGSENAAIKILTNPTKLWKEGKIYAHPVNIKL